MTNSATHHQHHRHYRITGLTHAHPCSRFPNAALKGEATKLDAHWKEKSDAMRRNDQNFVRHFQAMNWGMSLSLVALALVFYQLAAQKPVLDQRIGLSPYVPSEVYKTLAVFSVFTWVVFAFLQVFRCVAYSVCGLSVLRARTRKVPR